MEAPIVLFPRQAAPSRAGLQGEVDKRLVDGLFLQRDRLFRR